jgi:hypothetical protein
MNGTRWRKLPGVRRGIFTRASTWTTADYILLIEGSRIHEYYRRVYFRDILGMVITRKRRIVVEAPWIVLMPALILAALFLSPTWRSTGLLIAALADAAIVLYLYIATLSFGCRLYVATAVGNIFVPSVYRIWQARKFMAAIEPAILEVQSPRTG